MPKIDTLYALGNAMTIIFLTTNHATDMSNKCPINATDMPKISILCAQISSKKCPLYAQIVPKICLWHAKDMPKTCQRYA